MMNIETIRNAEPVEQTLRGMIESRDVNILIDESCTEETILTVLRAAGLYLRSRDGGISVRLIGERKNAVLLKKAAAFYGMVERYRVIGAEDASGLLTAFLGCSALVTEDGNGAAAAFAAELHETRILPVSGAEEKLENGAFTVDRTPESLCAVFLQLGERKYTTELTGHRWLV